MLVEEIKDNKRFYEKLEDALNLLIDRYGDYFDLSKENRAKMLDNFSRDLERVANLLDNFGYTYTPTDIPDMSEATFEVVVNRYLDSFRKYIEGEGNLETLNVDIKNLLTLVDKHKVIKEHFE